MLYDIFKKVISVLRDFFKSETYEGNRDVHILKNKGGGDMVYSPVYNINSPQFDVSRFNVDVLKMIEKGDFPGDIPISEAKQILLELEQNKLIETLSPICDQDILPKIVITFRGKQMIKKT